MRCRLGEICTIADHLARDAADLVFDAQGGALIPSLHDDHLHLLAMAARKRSVTCGPPEITQANQLKNVLQSADGTGWIRGVDYHESVAGDLSASQIDRWVDDRPVRIQHRSGRVWYFNSLGVREMGLPLDKQGQLYRRDEMVFKQLATVVDLSTELGVVARELASFGVTDVTDATPSNDDATIEFLRESCPDLRVHAMGGPDLTDGHLKIILDDYRLPEFRELCDQITEAHRVHRAVAIHCVSKVEVVFAVAALSEVGSVDDDRLEHATELTPDVMDSVQKLGLKLVPNPNFIFDRGDQYVIDNESSVLDSLYPIGSALVRGIRCSFGTDAPFGGGDPWRAIKAATDRRTRNGATLGSSEAIRPEDALRLFNGGREINVGAQANLVCLNRTWSEARDRLNSDDVVATFIGGRRTYLRE